MSSPRYIKGTKCRVFGLLSLHLPSLLSLHKAPEPESILLRHTSQHPLLSMDKSNDADNTPKPFGHDWDLHVEKYCRRGMVEQYNYAKNSLLADINTGMKNGAKRMEDAAAVLAAQDRRMADRLANDIPMGKDLDEKLCRDAINYMRDYMRNKYGVDILSSALESFHAPDVETMAIASNIEECIVIRNFGGRSAGESHQGDTTQVSLVCQRQTIAVCLKVIHLTGCPRKSAQKTANPTPPFHVSRENGMLITHGACLALLHRSHPQLSTKKTAMSTATGLQAPTQSQPRKSKGGRRPDRKLASENPREEIHRGPNLVAAPTGE